MLWCCYNFIWTNSSFIDLKCPQVFFWVNEYLEIFYRWETDWFVSPRFCWWNTIIHGHLNPNEEITYFIPGFLLLTLLCQSCSTWMLVLKAFSSTMWYYEVNFCVINPPYICIFCLFSLVMFYDEYIPAHLTCDNQTKYIAIHSIGS